MNSPKQQRNLESKLLLPRVTCTVKAQMVVGLESQAHCIVASRILVWRASWMGVSFGSNECFDLFGLLFLTYYVL